ncbi:gamma-glutamyltranspeptidase family protein, partial [Penicillium herquei]
STSISGDIFYLFYNVKTKKVYRLNSSRRVPINLILKKAQWWLEIPHNQVGNILLNSILAVITPGVILKPTISLAEYRFPVSEILVRLVSPNYHELLKAKLNRAVYVPIASEIMINPSLALFEELEHTKKILPLSSLRYNSVKYIYTLVKVLCILFVRDPTYANIPNLLSNSYIVERVDLFNGNIASKSLSHSSPVFNSYNIVYFTVINSHRNTASIVNSNYHSFGTRIILCGYGFTLQSYRANFSLIPSYLNILILDKSIGYLYIEGEKERVVYIEEGIDLLVMEELYQWGYTIKVLYSWDRELFSRG